MTYIYLYIVDESNLLMSKTKNEATFFPIHLFRISNLQKKTDNLLFPLRMRVVESMFIE